MRESNSRDRQTWGSAVESETDMWECSRECDRHTWGSAEERERERGGTTEERDRLGQRRERE